MIATGDAAAAETTLIKVTTAEPRWGSAQNALGWAYHAGGKFPDAIVAYRKASEIEPNNAASVAGLLVTTEAMVAEHPKKESAGGGMPGGGMGGGGMGGMDF